MGMDADTVIPTFKTRYIDDAAKTIPRMEPVSTAGMVNSLVLVSSAGMYGLNAFGFSSSAALVRLVMRWRLARVV
jgi:hypothetical protein